MKLFMHDVTYLFLIPLIHPWPHTDIRIRSYLYYCIGLCKQVASYIASFPKGMQLCIRGPVAPENHVGKICQHCEIAMKDNCIP